MKNVKIVIGVTHWIHHIFHNQCYLWLCSDFILKDNHNAKYKFIKILNKFYEADKQIKEVVTYNYGKLDRGNLDKIINFANIMIS